MNAPPESKQVPVSLLAPLLAAAERQWLPDALIRAGIRRLLRARLDEIHTPGDCDPVESFLTEIDGQPIAVATDTANEQHYEVPAAFFQRVLGKRLKYSCCYWPPGTRTLDQAEREALAETCQHADLQDGMEVLELGCGWGSLSLWMAEMYPHCRITAVSNSQSQRRFIEQRAADAQFNNLTVVTADVNDFHPPGQFDRIVSVEMFEHLRNVRELTCRVADWLKADGRLFVHVFCHRHTPYLYDSSGDQNWMGRYFFSGGMMPSADLLPRAATCFDLVEQWTWPGTHYAQTCRAWLENQDRHAAALQGVLSATYTPGEAARWKQRWRIFWMACEELFAFAGGREWFVSHYLFQRSTRC